MQERTDVLVERLADTGQWFEPGARADYFPVEYDPRQQILQTAALGSYEVTECRRVMVDQQPWLDVRLRRLFQAR